jgi:hypothetical protein
MAENKKRVVWICDVEGWAFANQARNLIKLLTRYEHKMIILKYDKVNKRILFDQKDKEIIDTSDIVLPMTPGTLRYTKDTNRSENLITQRNKVVSRLSSIRSM